MKTVLIIGNWIKTHMAISIIGAVLVIGSVVTPVILLNQSDRTIPSEELKQNKKEPKEPELNEDGCPVGSFLNYYGICQDEHLYEPQECPEGQMWYPNRGGGMIDNGDGTVTPDYKSMYGIDGLPVGACDLIPELAYEEACERYANDPNAAPCSDTEYGRQEYESYMNNYKSVECGRGFFYNPETESCVDMREWYRATYERYVLGIEDAFEKHNLEYSRG